MIAPNIVAVGLMLSAPFAAGEQPSQVPPAAERKHDAAAVYDFEIVTRYPHDPNAFTQGLLWHDGYLYESTGRAGASTVRKVDLLTGSVVVQRSIPSNQFGEGLALWKGDLISLTWMDGVIHRWHLDDLMPMRSDTGFAFEGWGLTHFENALIASDGSDTLRFLDPVDYQTRKTVSVTFNGRPLSQLNELELVDGMVFARAETHSKPEREGGDEGNA